MNTNFKSRCHVSEHFGLNTDRNLYLNSIYIECNYLLIQILIVYERNSFFWTGEDNFKTDRMKFFADVPRALNKFRLIRLIDEDSNTYFAPSNLYKYSILI